MYDCDCRRVKVKVMLRPTVSSASPSWRKAPIWDLRPDLCYCWTVAGLLMGGALSDERTGSAVLGLLSVCTICILQIIKWMYIQHIQGLCQLRLSTAENALLLVAPATIVHGFWIDERIYCILWYSAWLHFTVQYCTLVTTVTFSLPLLGSSFQRQTFPFLWVPEDSPAPTASF
jgi:hypothetical protein